MSTNSKPAEKKVRYSAYLILLLSVLVIASVIALLKRPQGLQYRRDIAARIRQWADTFRKNPNNQDSVVALRNMAVNPDRFARSYAIGTLGTLADLDPSVVATVAHGLRDNDPFVRESAGATLSRMGKRASPAINDLVDALKTYPNQGVSSHAAQALQNIGVSSPEVLEALLISAQAKDSCYPDDKMKVYRSLSSQ